MILLINSHVGHHGATSPEDRGYIIDSPRAEVFRYMIYSYSKLPWTIPLFNLDLSTLELEERKQIYDDIENLFQGKAILSNTRAAYRNEWLQLSDQVEDLGDLVWYTGCHDFPYIAYDLIWLDHCIDKLKNTKELSATIFCHYQEFLEQNLTNYPGVIKKAELDEDGILVAENVTKLCMMLMHSKLFKQWWQESSFGDDFVPRSDWLSYWEAKTPFQVFIPPREFCRHFNGYSHALGRRVPVLSIPVGFFEKEIKIRYGYSDEKEGWTSLNPARPSKMVDSNGVDIQGVLEDLPLFWKDHISDIDINPDINQDIFLEERNKVYKSWVSGNIPESWMNNYLR
jgi:hypothetical protein